MDSKKQFSTKYVDVLDGVRAISVIIVLIFHFWQQTWIFPTLKTPFLGFLGIRTIDFTPFAKVGYLFVDMMVLISGFLLFLPVARNMLFGEPLSKWRDYYKKRAVRILPSYLFCVLALFVYELAADGYGGSAGRAILDLLSHLTFTHMWRVETYLSTKLNVVLWTLAVEVWFYILFPIIAGILRRKKKEKVCTVPVLRAVIAAAVMIGISFIYIYLYALNTGSGFTEAVDGTLAALGSGIRSSYPSMIINQLPAFFGTYAVGLLGALVYAAVAAKLKPRWWTGGLFTAASVGFIYVIVQMIKSCAALPAADAQIWQMTQRLPLALVFMGFILCTAFSARWFRFLFANPLMRFLSIISYNLYIWHQWLCVKLKNDWNIPAWPEGPADAPPNQWQGSGYSAAEIKAGKAWSAEYALVITLFAFGAAILATYLIERPAADLLNGRKSIYNGKIAELFSGKKRGK